MVAGWAKGQGIDYGAAKEKVYLHTNHVFFKQGETLFFKAYVVNARTQQPTPVSNTLYVDLLNPSGNLEKKLVLPVVQGASEGSFDFAEGAVGGIYHLRAYTTWMQNERDSSFFDKEITVQKLISPRVLLKLDFPKKGYGPGSEVVADFSMRNLMDQPIKLYPVSFRVSVGGRVILADKLETDAQGKAKLSFRLPADLDTPDGLINVVVNYDAYTESISRSIPIVLGKIDLQFMPEGGSLVSGLASRIAFRAVDEFGKPADIRGQLRNGQGVTVAEFESLRFGMGSFGFTPLPGETYTATITSPAGNRQTFVLPPAASGGVVMNVEADSNQVRVRLRSSKPTSLRLEGSSRGFVYYSQELKLEAGETNCVIDAGAFPVGISVFSLKANQGIPLAERLVFLNADKNLDVSITTDKQHYLPREKVRLTIHTRDENGRPLPANLSLSVFDDKLWTLADDKQDHILSWLLLHSELRGRIEEPAFYFRKEEPVAARALDLVMLTHGYRYFDYIDEVTQTRSLRFEPDQDQVLGGKISDPKGNGVPSRLYLINSTTGMSHTAFTDSAGRFFFSHLQPNNRYHLIAQAGNGSPHIAIVITQNGRGFSQLSPAGRRLIHSGEDRFVAPGEEKPASTDVSGKSLSQLVFPAKQANHLSEVVVTGYGTQLRKEITGAVSRVMRNDMITMGYFSMALEGRVAGLQIVQLGNPGADPKIRIRGNRTISGANQPLFVVNGIVVEQAELNVLQPGDIQTVTVLRDAEATAIYGSRGANGVIIIETALYRTERWKLRLSQEPALAVAGIFQPGPSYSAIRHFYQPVYETTSTESRTDFRETIYWNPVVQTNGDGEARVEFYNSDASTTFRAVAEGISWNGRAGRSEATYSTRPALTTDAKIPPYLTVGDKARIPLFLKNNTDEQLKIQVSAEGPAELAIGDFNKTVVLMPDSACGLQIPVEAKQVLSGNIIFRIVSPHSRESLILPVSVAAKGFPVVQTYSGNKSGGHSFSLNHPVPGTVLTKLRLFTSLEGQLLDGIESMLREPHGCFEQTSSSTYPNVFVLKYLRESGKSNPAIEKKALDYIRQGYQRLIGFETKENGFEWFGNTPAHEALTAYGLLEFTDMQEFVQVDQRMLSRTREFLLNRRDGQGGFRQPKRGYDQFASVPNRIADVYIVYALTQAGVGAEIVKEYQAALNKALQSNDGYLLAMMALAADNMKDTKGFGLLMDALNNLYALPGLGAETSVVNSRDASLRVETASLYALALMRSGSPDLGRVAALIERILKEKNYYGYGSTQATVLALKAIVEFGKYAARQGEASGVQFLMNGKNIKPEIGMDSLIRESENRFEVSYRENANAIPYSLDVAYQTFTPPNSVKAELGIRTKLETETTRVGETVRMNVEVTNLRDTLQAMAIAKLGIPAGLSVQPWQLKELIEKKQVAYYEMFDNYLVLYWMGFAAGEKKQINLDLKAEVPGDYQAKASTVYLYYMPEHKNWSEGTRISIR